MHASKYPYKILLWLLKPFIKECLFQLKQNSFSAACITLQRHLDEHKRCGTEQLSYCNKCAVWTVLSSDDEGKFIDYITTASHIHYGLTTKEILELAHEFANKLTNKVL
jgi:hypothetical protein